MLLNAELIAFMRLDQDLVLTEDVIGRVGDVKMEVMQMAAFHSSAGTVRMMLLGSTVEAAGRRSHVTGVVHGNCRRKGDKWVGEVK